MNLKNSRGVTLIVLVITIIVMAIILSITLSSGADLLKNTQKNRLKTNLYIIKAKAETFLEDYIFDHPNLSDVSNAEIEEYLHGDRSTNLSEIRSAGYQINSMPEINQCIYCKWYPNDLKDVGIDTSNIPETEVFIVKYDIINNTVDVGSKQGYFDKNEDKEYHLLSELE